MLKRTKFLIAALCFAAATPAFAETEWHYVGTGTSGSKYYVRTADWNAGHSRVRDGRMWVMSDDSRDANVPWRSSTVFFAVDCVEETYAAITGKRYYPSGRHLTVPPTHKLYAIPDSLMAAAVGAYCEDPR